MPRRKLGSGWIPPLRPHRKPDGQVWGRVWFGGKYHHCGLLGTPEAEAEYRKLIAEWMASGQAKSKKPSNNPSVSELLEAFSAHAEFAYRHPSGGKRKSSELCIYRILVGYVNELHGALPIADFRPSHLKTLRERFLVHRWTRKPGGAGKPWSRRQVNDHVRRVIRIFRWGVETDFVPPDVLHRLETLAPLRRGKTTALDHPERTAVTWPIVVKTLRHLTKDAAALVQVLWLTGARSGELCCLCANDLNRSGSEWLFSPTKHKTAQFEKRKDIWFGRQAQTVLQPFIDSCNDPAKPIFSTRDEAGRRWLPHYTPDSLSDAVGKAARRAGVPHWSPKQLRAGRATQVEEYFDLDHAAAVLGDRLDTTRRHYAKSKTLARAVAREIG